MERKRFLYHKFLIVLVFSILVVGCSNGDKQSSKDKSMRILFYKQEIVEGMNEMAKLFMEQNPNVSIENEMIGTEYNAVLKTKDTAGKLPQVFAASTPGERALKPYIDAGKIIDVSNFNIIQQLPKDYRDSITFSDGNIYVIPFLTTARGIIFNEKLFEKAGISEFPKTLDEMKVACQKLKAVDVIPFACGAKDGWTLGSLIFQPGQEVFSTQDWIEKRNNGEASFKDNALLVFDFIDLFLENVQEKPLDTDYIGSVELYATEQAAMIIQGPWVIDIIAELDDNVANQSRMAAIPFTNNENKLYFDYDLYFCVSSEADVELVNQYFDFMINGEGRKVFKSHIKSINPYGIEYETRQVEKDILKAVEAGETIENTQYINMPDGFWQTLAIGMQEYVSGKLTKEQVLEKFDRDWDNMK